VPEDVQRAAGPTLAHRLLLDPGAAAAGEDPAALVDEVMATVAVPLTGA
jgi:MoxR-like ATPase